MYDNQYALKKPQTSGTQCGRYRPPGVNI